MLSPPLKSIIQVNLKSRVREAQLFLGRHLVKVLRWAFAIARAVKATLKNSLGLANIACGWRKGTTVNMSATANVVESLLQPLSHIKEALDGLSLKLSCYVECLLNYLLKQFTWAWFDPLTWTIKQIVENIYPRIYNLKQATPTLGPCRGVFTVRVVFQIHFRRWLSGLFSRYILEDDRFAPCMSSSK